jgi:hypothetical protein
MIDNWTVDPGRDLRDAAESGKIRGYAFGPEISSGVGAFHLNGNIYIGTNRFFFSGTSATGGQILDFQGLTLQQMQAVVLIHELLHLNGIVGADNANQTITLGNGQQVVGSGGVTKAVIENCITKPHHP